MQEPDRPMPGGRVPSPSWRAPARTNPVTSSPGKQSRRCPCWPRASSSPVGVDPTRTPPPPPWSPPPLGRCSPRQRRRRPRPATASCWHWPPSSGAGPAQAAARAALGRDQLAQPRAGGHHAAFQARLTTVASLRALGCRIQLLDREIADHPRAITALVRAWRPELLTRPGMGPIVAATVLCAWSHPGRCPSDAALAMLAGATPIPASSGQTVRVRLNRSGDRQFNQAFYTVVLTRLRTDLATRAYALRRRAQGRAKREIKRCLVRYVARQLDRLLEAHPPL